MGQMTFIDSDELADKIYCLKYDIKQAIRTIEKTTYSKTLGKDVKEDKLNDFNRILRLVDNYLSSYEKKTKEEEKP